MPCSSGGTGRNRKHPQGRWLAREDQERFLLAVIWAARPDQEPGWPALLDEGAVPLVIDAEANVWLLRALRAVLGHWRYRPRNLPPP